MKDLYHIPEDEYKKNINMFKVSIVWTAGKIAYLVMSIITGVVIHSGIFVLIGSTSFWVLQNSELTSILANNDYGLRTYADKISKQCCRRQYVKVEKEKFLLPIS